MDRTLTSLLDETLRSDETLLWSEELSLKPYRFHGWRGILIRFAILNAGLFILYKSRLGDMSFETLTYLLATSNCGMIAVTGVELYFQFRAMKSQSGHAVTDQRILTVTWHSKLLSFSINQIPTSKIATYRFDKEKPYNAITFHKSRFDPKVEYVINTDHDLEDIREIMPEGLVYAQRLLT